MEQLPPPKEKELPAPHEKLLKNPTFWERQGKTAKWLAIGSITFFLFLMLSTLLLLSQKSTSVPVQPTQSPTPAATTLNNIEISSDQKSILNADTKKVIFTIEDAKAFLQKSGYAYNPDTFYNTNTKYLGDCFGDAALSNNKYRIVFSAICLPGDAPQPWIGIYNLPLQTNCPPNAACAPNPPPFQFLIGGSGRNFTWSQDDSTITYQANLGLSGLTETRTIDSNTGKILEKKNSPVTPIPNTSGWKTYRNEKLGFELTLPNKNWYLPSATDSDPHLYANEECLDIKTMRQSNIDCSGLEIQDHSDFTINGLPERWEDKFNESKAEGLDPVKLSSLIPKAIVIKSDAPGPAEGWNIEYDIFFQTEKKNFLIFSDNEALEKDIISTFKLLDQTSK